MHTPIHFSYLSSIVLFRWFTPYVTTALTLTMMGMGMTLTIKDFQSVATSWRYILLGVTCHIIIAIIIINSISIIIIIIIIIYYCYRNHYYHYDYHHHHFHYYFPPSIRFHRPIQYYALISLSFQQAVPIKPSIIDWVNTSRLCSGRHGI